MSYLHDQRKFPAAATLQLPANQHGDLDALLRLSVRSAAGKLVPIRELVTTTDTVREQPVYHKDLLPVNYVVADMAGRIDSPLYGMFAMRGAFFILDDPIFNGLANPLIFGIFVSTLLMLVVIPLLYYIAWRNRHGQLAQTEQT